MLEIQGLTKKYGKFLALDNLNLHIDKGEIFGFVGPNGAGKSSLSYVLSGKDGYEVTSGEILCESTYSTLIEYTVALVFPVA